VPRPELLWVSLKEAGQPASGLIPVSPDRLLRLLQQVRYVQDQASRQTRLIDDADDMAILTDDREPVNLQRFHLRQHVTLVAVRRDGRGGGQKPGQLAKTVPVRVRAVVDRIGELAEREPYVRGRDFASHFNRRFVRWWRAGEVVCATLLQSARQDAAGGLDHGSMRFVAPPDGEHESARGP